MRGIPNLEGKTTTTKKKERWTIPNNSHHINMATHKEISNEARGKTETARHQKIIIKQRKEKQNGK